ncbi:MAG: beta-L-arabinofuranosidase domain-containing protein [Bacteroidota bacterium]
MPLTNKIFLILWISVFIRADVFCQDVLFNAKIEKVFPFPGAAVVLKPSWIKQREDLNTAYLKSLDADRLLHNFRVNAGIASNAKPLEGWEAPNIGLRGHFTGHYLSAISKLVEKYNDSLLSKRLVYIVDELYKCQQSFGNGYLSAFPEKDFDILETTFGGVWAPYYTFHKIMQGLLDTYILTGNNKAYQMVTGMAAWVKMRMSKLSPEAIEKMLYTADANPANEPGAMNDVLYKLYKISHNADHLAMAKIFDRDWFVKPLSKNHDILSGLHSNTHLALVTGFAERYAITKEPLYHDAVINFWNMLTDAHEYANGSSSGPRPNATTHTSLTAEHWGEPKYLSNTMTREIAESCVSHNTQKLTSVLFTWTADPKYAGAYMNTFYNAVLPVQNKENGTNVYHLPLGSPRVKVFLKENDFRCCNGTGIEAFANLNNGIYYHSNTDLWVNLYIPSEVTWSEKNIVLKQNGNFPADSSVEFTLAAKNESAFNLNLFVPGWAKKAEVYINGQKKKGVVSPGSYYRINRTWKNNDKIKLVFHYNFHIKAMPDNPNTLALFYGPNLLAFEASSEIILKGSSKEILKNLSVTGNNVFQLKNNDKMYVLRPLYDIVNQSYGVYATIREY